MVLLLPSRRGKSLHPMCRPDGAEGSYCGLLSTEVWPQRGHLDHDLNLVCIHPMNEEMTILFFEPYSKKKTSRYPISKELPRLGEQQQAIL